MNANILQGNALELLDTLEPESVQTCITSPPYWGLRDYQTTPQLWDASTNCNHNFQLETTTHENRTAKGLVKLGEKYAGGGHKQASIPTTEIQTGFCKHCTGWLGELGQEPTPELFIDHLVQIFRKVAKVLKDDGTLWVNIGDSYANDKNWKSTPQTMSKKHRGEVLSKVVHGNTTNLKKAGLKNKDLVGIPWMLAFALRADGWYLRQDIIWAKKNGMPESVTDRCTKSHEYIFLLSKSQKYYFDHEAIKEDAVSTDNVVRDRDTTKLNNTAGRSRMGGLAKNDYIKKNKRSVWHIATQPFKEAHFATFPPELIRPCILAGSKTGDTVMDVFNGAGTTGLVALQHGRNYTGLELNQDFIDITNKRLASTLAQPAMLMPDQLERVAVMND